MARVQFSLGMLLAAVAVVAIGAALWVAEPSWPVGLLQALFVMAGPACAAAAAIQRQGARRIFGLGVAFALTIPATTYFYLLSNECRVLIADRHWTRVPIGTQQLFIPDGLEGSPVFFKLALCQWSLAPLVGLLCVLTQRLFLPPATSRERKERAEV